MSIEVGTIIEGVVTGVTNFGAFVDLGDSKVGLVHISEVSGSYVKNIAEFLKVQDKVRVKVLSLDERGKIALSIRQAQPTTPSKPSEFNERPRIATPKVVPTISFEDKLSRFLKDSGDRLLDLKKNTENKRGKRSGGRKES